MERVDGSRVWAGLAHGVVTAVLVGGGGFTAWYRATYNVMPGQGAVTRVHWCGRGLPVQWRCCADVAGDFRATALAHP